MQPQNATRKDQENHESNKIQIGSLQNEQKI